MFCILRSRCAQPNTTSTFGPKTKLLSNLNKILAKFWQNLFLERYTIIINYNTSLTTHLAATKNDIFFFNHCDEHAATLLQSAIKTGGNLQPSSKSKFWALINLRRIWFQLTILIFFEFNFDEKTYVGCGFDHVDVFFLSQTSWGARGTFASRSHNVCPTTFSMNISYLEKFAIIIDEM